MSRLARQAIIAVYRATFPKNPDWAEGPLPLAYDGMCADTAGRSTYYPSRTARLLYGTSERPRRWHRTGEERFGGVSVTGVEALRPDERPGSDGLVIIHLSSQGAHPVEVLRALAGRRGAGLPDYDASRIAGDQVDLLPGPPFTLAFVTSRGRRLPRIYRHPRYRRWPSFDQWQWSLASRTAYVDQPPDPRTTQLPEQKRIWISADWSVLILREGMALLGTRPDLGASDPFYNHAALYARTIYLDAVLIGLLQLHGIRELEDDLSAVHDPGSPMGMSVLEHHIARFRHRLWWQHLSAHGVPNQFLEELHLQHRLPERFEQILSEVSDYNHVIRAKESTTVNGSVLLFTLATVPAAIALAFLQVLGPRDAWVLAAVLVGCVFLTGLLLATRPARTAVRALRNLSGRIHQR
ncbi:MULTISPECIES: hypothetical protein [unclassified Nocardiopsis]|uniref:hypothetical protein n=1 Tax=unclassified Nocardiopsis TaxID=2649073 RepID=UPI00135B5630|nr:MULTISPECIES: hypothetical protein [unclassified Nocardiopsis]